MGNRNNIQSLHGAGWKDSKCPFSAHMSGKKKGKNNKNQICLWGSIKWRVQLTTYNNHAQMGTSAKEGKIILLAHKLAVAKTKLHVFPSSFHPPLNSGCLWLPTTWVRPDSPTTHPNQCGVRFPQSVLSFLSTSWLKIPETILLTNVLIYILSVCLSGFQFAFVFRFWIRVVKSSPQFALYICKTFSVLLTLDKTWWGGGTSTLFTGKKSNNQC